MKKDRWWLCIVPLYAFTLVFVLGPVLYMIAISFAQNTAGTGFRWAFTLDNFAKMRDGVYLQCFRESFQLAVSTTLLNVLIGYPFGYFMGREGEAAADVPHHGAVLDQLAHPALRLDHHFAGQGHLQ